jgi:uncharacterized protein with HEPN domain
MVSNRVTGIILSLKYYMSKRSPELLLNDILDCAQTIMEFTLEYDYQQFLSDRKTRDAVVRNFEIIGEAANRLPENIKNGFPEVLWFKIRGFRNRLVYEYFGIDYQIVWDTRNELLPDLVSIIKYRLSITE